MKLLPVLLMAAVAVSCGTAKKTADATPVDTETVTTVTPKVQTADRSMDMIIEASQKDPQGPAEPEKDKYRVIRGGSYIYGESHTRASFRSGAKLDDPAIDFGFRCVK